MVEMKFNQPGGGFRLNTMTNLKDEITSPQPTADTQRRIGDIDSPFVKFAAAPTPMFAKVKNFVQDTWDSLQGGDENKAKNEVAAPGERAQRVGARPPLGNAAAATSQPTLPRKHMTLDELAQATMDLNATKKAHNGADGSYVPVSSSEFWINRAAIVKKEEEAGNAVGLDRPKKSLGARAIAAAAAAAHSVCVFKRSRHRPIALKALR